jgi:hypothetical protein
VAIKQKISSVFSAEQMRDESTIVIIMALWSSPMRIDVNENFHHVMCYAPRASVTFLSIRLTR